MPDPVKATVPQVPSTPAPQVDTQSTPNNAPLMPPTNDMPMTPGVAKQTPVTPPLAPAKPGSFYEHLSHAFAGALMGTASDLTGGDTVTTGYDNSKTDPKTGGPLAITRPATAHDRIAKIAGAALRGLAAGAQSTSQDPSNPGGAAFGAGFQAQNQFTQKQDLLKRQQSAEQYKTDQETLLRRGEIARNNALTTQVYLGNLKTTNDLNPSYAEYSAIYDAARKSPELQGHVSEITGTELQDAVKKDPNFLSNHMVKPLGLAPTMGPDGPLMHEDGITPMQHMRYGVIDGTKDGMMPVTPELEGVINQYGGKLLGSKPKVGDTIPLDKFIPMMNALDTEKLNVINGWQQSTVGTTADGKTPVEINAYNRESRPLQTITAANKEALDKGILTKAQADEAEGKAAESRANAAVLMGGVGGNNPEAWRSQPDIQHAIDALPASAKAVVNTVNPVNIRPLIMVANGDMKITDAFPSNPRKGTGLLSTSQAAAYIPFFNPQYSEHYFTDVQNIRNDFTSHAPNSSGVSVTSFNNFLNHSAEVLDMSGQLTRSGSPWVGKTLNEIHSQGMGEPGVGNLDTAIMAARNEWQTFIHNGHAPTADETKAGETLMNDSSTPAMIAGALRVMGNQAIGRMDSINQKYKTVTGTDYPNLITPMGKTSAGKIGLDVSAYKSGGQIPGAPVQATPSGPDPSTHPHRNAPNGTLVFQMPDNTVQDAAGNKYDPKTLAPLQPTQGAQ